MKKLLITLIALTALNAQANTLVCDTNRTASDGPHDIAMFEYDDLGYADITLARSVDGLLGSFRDLDRIRSAKCSELPRDDVFSCVRDDSEVDGPRQEVLVNFNEQSSVTYNLTINNFGDIKQKQKTFLLLKDDCKWVNDQEKAAAEANFRRIEREKKELEQLRNAKHKKKGPVFLPAPTEESNGVSSAN